MGRELLLDELRILIDDPVGRTSQVRLADELSCDIRCAALSTGLRVWAIASHRDDSAVVGKQPIVASSMSRDPGRGRLFGNVVDDVQTSGRRRRAGAGDGDIHESAGRSWDVVGGRDDRVGHEDIDRRRRGGASVVEYGRNCRGARADSNSSRKSVCEGMLAGGDGVGCGWTSRVAGLRADGDSGRGRVGERRLADSDELSIDVDTVRVSGRRSVRAVRA